MNTERRIACLTAVVVLVWATLACSAPSTITPAPAADQPTDQPMKTPFEPIGEATTPFAEPVGEATVPPEAPSPTPAAVEPGGCTFNSAYVADVTVPDDTPFTPGAAFAKTWRIRNSGSCNWEAGTSLVFFSGERMGGPTAVTVGAVATGASVDVSVNLTAPSAPGTYRSNWQLQAPGGARY